MILLLKEEKFVEKIKVSFKGMIYRSNKKTFYAFRYFTLLGRPSKAALPHPVSADVFALLCVFLKELYFHLM